MNKICLCGNENEILSRKVNLWFGLSQKENNNGPQPKRFVNFSTFSHTFITFKNVSMNTVNDLMSTHSLISAPL